jgi:hypothetical protein
MKTGLWKQRRQKDVRLVEVWRKEDTKVENSSHDEEPTRDEEDDRWMEELTLTDMDRRELEEFDIYNKNQSSILQLKIQP